MDPHTVDATERSSDDIDVTTLRIGFHTDNGIATPALPIQDAILNAISLLKANGFKVDEATPPGIEMASLIYSSLFGADGGETLQMLLDDCRTQEYSPQIADLVPKPEQQNYQDAAMVINLWDNYRSSMLGYFEHHDVLICPVNAHTAIPHGETENMMDYSYTSAFNLTGWPGLVLRCGTDESGLPIGLQILARPFREDHCLALGKAIESLISEHVAQFPPPQIHC